MNILTEIINQLIDSNNSLTDSLLKIKVLASRLGNKPLYNWVDKEISGYKPEDKIPEYRITGCVLVGNVMNGNWHLKNQIMPTLKLPDFVKEHIDKIEFEQGISALERYIKENENPLAYAIPSEILPYLTELYVNMGNHYASVYYARKQVDLGVVQEIITEIRNKTLDLLLKLEEEFGVEIELDELMKKKDQVNQMINNTMNHIVITNSDGNVVTTGSKNLITATIKIEKANFEELKKVLNDHHVLEEDIQELHAVIDEQPNYEKKLFGPKVNTWIQKMTNKALNGTWQVGIGTAGTLLAELLMKYYGM
jgi:hypothetical protein